jgi:hypothetical protein
MTMTEDHQSGHPLGLTPQQSGSAREAVNDMLEAGLLDELMERVDAGGLALTGEGGFLPEMVKAVLERGLATELTEHLGYERGDPGGRGSGNSRNGTTPKTLATEVGDVALAVPRDRAGSFEPRLVPKGARRAGGLDDMIISLYAGGMTVRDIGHHLHRTLGVELSHDTISKITDSVLEEVKAWQHRPLEELYPIIYLDALVVKVRDGHQAHRRLPVPDRQEHHPAHPATQLRDGPAARRRGHHRDRALARPRTVWRASHISDSGPNKVPVRMEEHRCGRSAGNTPRSSSLKRFALWSTPRVLSPRLPAR